MNEQSWQRAENIFHGALELAPETRFAFLDEACGPDLALRREVDSLLAHDSETDSTFAGPPEIAGGNYEVPRTIAHYHVSAKLGQGGMGTVYRATDSRLGRDVAIKLMPRSFAGDDGRSARFTREAKVLASLNHPHICTVHGLEDAAGQPAIVMELVEGETLAQRLLKGPLPLHELLEFAAQIADALAASHRGGVIHRDLKPANIMLAGLGGHPVVKVLDFGLATPPDAVPAFTGAILGTPKYMSPEQLRGVAADPRSDLFSLGVVLFEMVTGKRPPQDSELANGYGDCPAPEKLKILIHRLLRKDPANRPGNALEVHRELEQLINPAASAGLSRNVRVALGVAAVLAAVLLGWMWRGCRANAGRGRR